MTDLPLSEEQRRALKVIDQRMADTTLSKEQHEELKKKRELIVEGVRESIMERLVKVEARLDALEGNPQEINIVDPGIEKTSVNDKPKLKDEATFTVDESKEENAVAKSSDPPSKEENSLADLDLEEVEEGVRNSARNKRSK